METKRPLTGKKGEAEAAQYLEKNGYVIVKYNYSAFGSEVDLIALKDETLCFVEVKTRGSDNFGMPEEFVDGRKQRKIIRAAKVFIGQKEYADFYVRFDIISVLHKSDNIEINHITHAFQEE